MSDRATIVARIEAYCRAQNEKDKAGWAALFADDVAHEDPVGMGVRRGKAHIVGAFWDSIVRNDIKIWLTDEIIVRGAEALAIMACDAGPEGARRRLAPVIDQFVFNDEGLIVSVRGFYNID